MHAAHCTRCARTHLCDKRAEREVASEPVARENRLHLGDARSDLGAQIFGAQRATRPCASARARAPWCGDND
eukprot:3810459-Pleurochrysis_carterae.AAC.1